MIPIIDRIRTNLLTIYFTMMASPCCIICPASCKVKDVREFSDSTRTTEQLRAESESTPRPVGEIESEAASSVESGRLIEISPVSAILRLYRSITKYIKESPT